MARIRLSESQQEMKYSSEAIFRSAPMTLVQFYVTIELARDMVGVLGNLGSVQFRDLNSKLTPFQRTFVNDLKSIDLMLNQLNFLHSIMIKQNTISGDIYINLRADTKSLPTTSEMDQFKFKLKDYFDRIKHLDDSFNKLNFQKLKLIENRNVINILNKFHNSSLIDKSEDSTRDIHFNEDDELDDNIALLNEQRNNSLELGLEVHNLDDSNFNTIAGTIARDKVPILRNILWRTLRGNLYFHDIPIDEQFPQNDNSKDLIYKNAFIIFIHGDMLRSRVRKIIQSLDGIIFDNACGSSQAREATLEEVNRKVQDLTNVVTSTKEQLVTELKVFQEIYPDYAYIIQREKLIYETLNKFDEDSTRRCLVGEGWIPSIDFDKIRGALKNLIKQKTRRNRQRDSSEEINISETSITENNMFIIDDGDGHEISGFEIDENNEEIGSLIAVVNELSTNRTPPTYHKTNKFTAAFQSIIDAYGIASYQEVNPGLATIITFPFMFAIMFGDLGHGFIVLLMALYLIKNEISFGAMRNKDEIFEMAFNGRYIILLMGFFSMYTGFIYNDIFSKSMAFFSSGWEYKFPENYDPKVGGTLTATKIPGKTYPFGLDWAWHGTENNLLFTNSYKMKLSVLMGYIHMNYSLMFSLVNCLFFHRKVDIIGNFIPGFLFMQSIFGYLALTIVYKWTVDWLGIGKQPPGLLNMLINMFLSPGTIEEQLYPGQKFVQVVLVLIALICVPWLLVYKPLTLKRQNDKAIKLGYSDIHSQRHHSIILHEEEEALNLEHELNNDPVDDSFDELDDEEFRFPNDIEPMFHSAGAHGDDHGEFNFGDIVIHQVIHTIEFCLNCVSHTASYLRLWALSLAHAQLSTVLWSMTIQNAFGKTGAVGVITTVVLFAMWFSLTVCILVLMEGTSAMLHSLRLHWVEAMSKFFEGEGYAYEPFTFKSIEL
ncbi:STV1 [Candida pseudojiufengensis]|uniref:STV1 n=1 Tax=Candida pseudojiufengensis TaxID=497109 RepID=UPI0022251C1B|nr:STV1 [Candida pseudojiufengensis]KAI5962953.1 STV1 [Candida pseudojiufengensis]